MTRTSIRSVVAAGMLALALPVAAAGQGVFRSTQSANLPTAAMLGGGSWMFEISHRFDTPISGGADALWGLDGPVRNRLGMIFAPHDRLMLGVQRTNFQDNLELNAKFRGVSIDSETVPFELAAQGGVAWNTQLPDMPPEISGNEMQLYVQVMANLLLADRLAVGVVPSLLRNPRLLDVDSETALSVGLHGQYYFNGTWSFLGEWIFSEARAGAERDSGTFGFEIRTRGHFFKLLATNQALMNPTQVLAGASNDFADLDDWRLGFNITRLLPF